MINNSRYAIGGFALSIIGAVTSFPGCVLTLPFAIVALVLCAKGKNSAQGGLAFAGKVISIAALAILAIWFIIGLIGGSK
jgi:hypothetical protein